MQYSSNLSLDSDFFFLVSFFNFIFVGNWELSLSACVFNLLSIIYILIDFIYLFIGYIGSSIAVHGLSLVVASGGYSSLRCKGFSLQWLLLLQSTGFRSAGFSSCGTRASVVVAHGL